ncbi:hypothetical protein [Amycolatopsis jiangsuensis]|uniref:Uncharacterized protein n=1 Tax=Amycolatopsis jiangsuensis TaxID=1181879 RepID=A0A840IZS1_9PSEU|nr:hypothetical protein [Amycolatopsis jiangsuensis]MBB4686905.1 hypothetical protein [Amycolatopsis jiangsuensis]
MTARERLTNGRATATTGGHRHTSGRCAVFGCAASSMPGLTRIAVVPHDVSLIDHVL